MPEPLDEAGATRPGPIGISGSVDRLRIVQAALLGCVLIYGFAAYLLRATGAVPEGGFVGRFPGLGVLRAALWVLAAAHYVAIRAIRARRLAPEALRDSGAPAESVQTCYVLLFALGEIVAAYGFVLFLLAGLVVDFLALAGLAIALLLWICPSREEYSALVGRDRNP